MLFFAQGTPQGAELVLGLIVIVVIIIVLFIVQAGSKVQTEVCLGSESASMLRPISHWEKLHRNPNDLAAVYSLQEAIVEELNRLMGPKTVEEGLVDHLVILRRSRLQYESHIKVYVDHDRHGFDVCVPTHGFSIRISCPRVVPDNVVSAPWDDLLENLCKIDRSIIKNRGSKSAPLVYVPEHGNHPMLRVEILSKPQEQVQPKGLPPTDLDV
jgi:hypothetical protein